MTTKPVDYRAAITARGVSPQAALDQISRVTEWWTAGFTGRAREVNDTFTLRWGKTFVDMKVAEIVPNKRVVWLVTDCNLEWISDKKEWKNTRVTWDVSRENGDTHISMTHVGLMPGVECYTDCEKGWNFYVLESLPKLFADGKGLPDGERR